jgi:hypothetical protein
MPQEDSMRTKPSFITRAIVAAATIGSIGTGIAVPVLTVAAPAATSAMVVHPDYIGYGS